MHYFIDYLLYLIILAINLATTLVIIIIVKCQSTDQDLTVKEASNSKTSYSHVSFSCMNFLYIVNHTHLIPCYKQMVLTLIKKLLNMYVILMLYIYATAAV